MASFIGFSCVQQRLERTDEKTVAEGASVIHARFELCPKWNGLTVYARFKHGAACYDVPIKGSAALIPWEVLKPTGFEVSVWGEDGEGGKLTSAALFVDVKPTVSLDGFEPIPSSPTLIQKFESMVQTCINTAASLRADADAGAFDGEPFSIVRTYSSVAEMQADESGAVEVGQYVVIDAGTVNDEDNAKLYKRTADGWSFIVDMSGASGSLEGVSDAGITGHVLTKTDSGVGWLAVFPETGATGQVLTKTEDGEEWQDLPEEIPSDGEAGNVLTKTSDGFEWQGLPEELPTGGEAGQVLAKTGDGEAWQELDDLIQYPISIEKGGTGSLDAAGARENLEITPENIGAAAAEHSHTLEDLGAAAAEHEHAAGDITSGTLGVARGGTGKATHTANAVLTGNGTSAVKNVATAAGALYATAANGAAKFGTLPIAQGGTGATAAASALTNLGVKDYVTAQGTSGIWKYRKWNSGLAECWGQKSYSSLSIDDSYDDDYYTTTGNLSFPFTFAEIPRAFSEVWAGTGLLLSHVCGLSASIVNISIQNNVSITSTPDVFIHAVGRWK